jgi:hypothetical protein
MAGKAVSGLHYAECPEFAPATALYLTYKRLSDPNGKLYRREVADVHGKPSIKAKVASTPPLLWSCSG